VCPIASLTGKGIEALLETVGSILDRDKERIELRLPHDEAPLLSLLRERGRILSESYDEDGIRLSARVTPKLAGQIRKLVGDRKHSDGGRREVQARRRRGDRGRAS
jgi:50S ribosomal subunit-associated GTPase HflX